MRRAAIAVTVALGLACAACGGTTRTSSTSQTTTETVATTLATTPTTSQGTATTGTGTSTTPTLPGTGKPQVTIGDKNTDEQFVIGQLYLQALQAQGFKVSLNQNIGPTEVTVQALSTGSLAMYPEYLDVFDTAIARDTRHFRTQVDAYEAAQRYARAHGLVLLPPTPFSNTEAIAVTDAYAEQNGLSSIGDLRHIAGTWTLGGPEQFQQLPPGLAQLRAAYGVTPPAFRSLAIGDQYDELDAGTIQAADVFTTDGELASGDYQLLADPRRIFGYGNVVPVISAKALAAEGVAFSDTIDDVDAYLTTPVMRELNAAADIAKENPADVAAQFLETHGLLAPLPGY